MTRTITFAFIIFILSIGCGVPQSDYDALKEKNKRLLTQIEECSLNAEQLYKQAVLSYDRIEYKKSHRLLTALIDRYPKTDAAKNATNLLKKVEKDLKTTEKALERDKLIHDSNAVLAKMKKRSLPSGITFYTDKSIPLAATKNTIHIYAGNKQNSKAWLGLSINRFSKNGWLHLQKIMIKIDGETFNIEEEKPDDFKTKKESGGYREWVDRALPKEQIIFMEKIANSDTTTLTLIGREVSEKRTVTLAEKKAMRNVLQVFKILGG